MVYYRKYRPQTLDEIIGQEHIKNALKKAHESNRLSHAYLFAGPKGSGKTSTARILAKMINCEVGGPCNKCSTCLSITDGSNLDLIEIDAASNRGIDDIRELREKIKLAPTSSKKKVYIIDEVHMLTTEAFNALLKTLEEPPSHVLFILATTDPHKIPQTILSRVQRFDFQAAKEEEIIEYLKNVIKIEKLKISDEALNLIAKKSEGSFRDGLKILDQLASSGNEITLEDVENIYKSGKSEDSIKLLNFIADADTKSALEFVTELSERGISLKEFINQTLHTLRLLLLIKHDTKKDESLSGLSQKLSSPQIVKIVNSLGIALEKMKFVSIPTLPLEIAVVESCQEQEVPRGERVSQVPQGEENNIGNKPRDTRDTSKPRDISNELISPAIPAPISDAQEIIIIKDKWAYILETIKPYNFSLEALLKQSKIVSFESETLILEVPYSFHKRILEAPKSRELLESVLAEVLGKSAKVSTVLGTRPVRVEELANVEVAADDEIIKIASEIFNS
ncbi:DNA polymerase III, subunit gamma and tau [Candidatus Daviesbacteria bacterium RIFCSPHIGHO2_12_FULL_37_16]|uniref:DNA polymerase III subunit gamma/tau n=1 Tax=Candidatus Daviesbacteria bacterium RIFCSPHIGHO2_12_FULL_37_16 TaxID=1797778 RepID=A0A1F5K531_9BACT|nr:MAG: DNA polymerase III, subunit gamma and tau [Candidatus Daviesbacteria bacterium RIFCSPHIGHO2_02_FULL_37_9]OGE35821.1 MAG: DNA polymerase III, subunit gamma and tau [Candidatus Daviesbacteria bacterium RIFCSPHIGHO2_12_FULL_37_16]